MPFQFHCPNGHLLEAEPFQAGQQCVCPMCGQLFLIPSPVGAAAAPVAEQPPAAFSPGYGQPGPFPGAATGPNFGPNFGPGPGAVPEPQPEPQGAAAPATESAASGSAPVLPFATQNTADLPVLHIPCPKGHELEVPRDMLNQFVECPQCQAQFTLRERDSVEFKRKHSAEMERRWEKAGQTWLQWAIIFAVLVVIGLVTLIALSP